MRPEKVFNARNFLQQRRFPNEKIRYCDTNNIRLKYMEYPALNQPNFTQPEIFWNTEEFSVKLFGNVRQTNFDEKA